MTVDTPVVVGAGIAGAASALAFAVAGTPTVLVGRSRVDRRRAVTLSRGAVRALADLGVGAGALAAVPDREQPGGVHADAARVAAALQERLTAVDVTRVVGTATLDRSATGGTRVLVRSGDRVQQWVASTTVVATGSAGTSLGGPPATVGVTETVVRCLVPDQDRSAVGIRAVVGTPDGGTCWTAPADPSHLEVGRSWAVTPGRTDTPAALLAGTALAGSVPENAGVVHRTTSQWRRRRPDSVAGPGWFAVGTAAGLVESPAADPVSRTLMAAADLPRAVADAPSPADAAVSWDRCCSDELDVLARLDPLLHAGAGGPDDVVARSRDLLALATDPMTCGPLLRARETEEGRRPARANDPWGPMTRLLG